jgi:hypothetical protein
VESEIAFIHRRVGVEKMRGEPEEMTVYSQSRCAGRCSGTRSISPADWSVVPLVHRASSGAVSVTVVPTTESGG